LSRYLWGVLGMEEHHASFQPWMAILRRKVRTSTWIEGLIVVYTIIFMSTTAASFMSRLRRICLTPPSTMGSKEPAQRCAVYYLIFDVTNHIYLHMYVNKPKWSGYVHVTQPYVSSYLYMKYHIDLDIYM
jgi:hypothetical protein